MKKSAQAPTVIEPVATPVELSLQDLLVSFGLDENQVAIVMAHVPATTTKKVKGSGKFKVLLVEELPKKMPMQMLQAYNSILGCEEVTKDEWVEKLSNYEGFKTTQPVERIIAFYQKAMIEAGLIAKL